MDVQNRKAYMKHIKNYKKDINLWRLKKRLGIFFVVVSYRNNGSF
jgi:hypothetical protein